MLKTIACFVPLAILAGGLGGCAMTPPGYDPRDVTTAHPPGHPDWDWYCPSDGGGYFPQVAECKVTWIGSPVGPTAKALADAKSRQDCARARDTEAQRQRTNSKRIAAQEAARRKVADDMKADIARHGYTRTTLADLILDFETIPSGQKLYFDGFYNRLGTNDTISASPSNANAVVTLSMEGTPRDARKRLLNCTSQRGLACAGTFLVHTGCTTMQFGVERHDVPCVVLDDVRDDVSHQQDRSG